MLQYNASGIYYVLTVNCGIERAQNFGAKRMKLTSRTRGNRKSVDVLLGRGRVPASSAVDVEAFSQFFADKVANVCQNTSGVPPPTFSCVTVAGVSFDAFKTND